MATSVPGLLLNPEMRFLTLRGATGAVRRETVDGREWVVVPIVALVEGVIHPVNAPAPELVRAALFRGSESSWENQPIFAGHPMDKGVPVSGKTPGVLETSFGHVRNALASDKDLRMEGWIDPERAKKDAHGARILERVTAEPPKPCEVSVGVFVNAAKGEGTWTNGRRYAAEWKSWQPDHLALFGDGRRGACNIDMGCGVCRAAEENVMRVAEDGTLEPLNEERPTMKLMGRMLEFFRAAMPRGWGKNDVDASLRDAIARVEPGAFDIVDWTDSRVVYCVWPSAGGGAYVSAAYANTPLPPEYYARDYKIENDKVTLGDRKEVEPTMTYPEIKAAGDGGVQDETDQPAACGCGHKKPEQAASAAEGDNMDRKARIAALVANPHSPVKSLKMLEAATDEELATLETQAGTIKAAAEKATADAATLKAAQDAEAKAKADLKAAQEASITEDKLSPELKAQLAAARLITAERAAADQVKKDCLVGKLKVAVAGIYTEEALKAMEVGQLESLAKVAKIDAPVQHDYSGQGVPRAAAAGDLSTFAPPDPWADLNQAATKQ